MDLKTEILVYIDKKRETNYHDLFRKFNDMDSYEQRNRDIMHAVDELVAENVLEIIRYEGQIPTYRAVRK